MTPIQIAEQRKHPRLQKKFVLHVSPEGGDETTTSQWTLVTSKNISAGGVMFTYDRPLEIGTKIFFKIFFPERSIQCSGVVHRTHPSVLEPLVNIAVRLDGFGRGDLEFIERYLI